MQTIFTISRLGSTALAAVLALSATPAFAQEVTPQETPQISVPQEAPPTVTVTPVTPVTTTATPDPLAAQPSAEIDTTAAPAAKATKATTARRAASAASTSARRASAAPVRATAPTVLPNETAPADPAVPGAIEAPLTAAPVAPLAEAPALAPAPEPVPTNIPDELPIALGAGLGLLALGGAAFALRRRRRDLVEEEVIYTEPTISRAAPAPAVRPDTIRSEPIAADSSAFSFDTPAVAATAAAATDMNWVERAHQGPSPENPFLSLKKRLQRAAFYDQRERAVKAGEAKPLSPMAGLPERFARAIRAKAAPRRTPSMASYGFSYAPA